MESMNFLTNSPGCLAGHASLPMESPEMSNCPASQSQETVEAKREPTTPSPNFPPTLQCESAGEQARVVLWTTGRGVWMRTWAQRVAFNLRKKKKEGSFSSKEGEKYK